MHVSNAVSKIVLRKWCWQIETEITAVHSVQCRTAPIFSELGPVNIRSERCCSDFMFQKRHHQNVPHWEVRNSHKQCLAKLGSLQYSGDCHAQHQRQPRFVLRHPLVSKAESHHFFHVSTRHFLYLALVSQLETKLNQINYQHAPETNIILVEN